MEDKNILLKTIGKVKEPIQYKVLVYYIIIKS